MNWMYYKTQSLLISRTTKATYFTPSEREAENFSVFSWALFHSSHRDCPYKGLAFLASFPILFISFFCNLNSKLACACVSKHTIVRSVSFFSRHFRRGPCSLFAEHLHFHGSPWVHFITLSSTATLIFSQQQASLKSFRLPVSSSFGQL